MSEPAPHDGYLGPDSVAWRVIGHPVSIVGGLRALIVQALHPLAMAGVAQHSDYRNRALDRLRRTAYYVSATTFGDTETAYGADRICDRESPARPRIASSQGIRRIHAALREEEGSSLCRAEAYAAAPTRIKPASVESATFVAAEAATPPETGPGPRSRRTPTARAHPRAAPFATGNRSSTRAHAAMPPGPTPRTARSRASFRRRSTQ